MHDNNKHEIKAKTKLTKSRLLRKKYGTNLTPGGPSISLLWAYHIKLEFRKLVEIGHHGKT